MAVFVLLMMALMQFVNSAQKLWTGIEQKNALYEDARVALDLMAKDIQSIFYEYDKVPFWNESSAANKRICFVTMSDTLPTNSASRFIEVQYFLDTATKKINISRVADNAAGGTVSSYWNFYQTNDSMNKCSDVFGTSFTDISKVPAISIQPLIPYVIEMNFSCFDNKMQPQADGRLVPYAIKIDLTMLDKSSYEKWDKSDTSAEVYVNNKRTFSRIVIIGNRGQFLN